MADTRSDPPYGYTAHMRGVSFDDARARVTEALKQEGFGILTEIDVQSTLKAKLDRSFRKYVILGACNPQLAHQALEAELGIGLLLPCNVCVWEEEDGSVVSMARPQAMFDLVRNAALQPVVDDADQRLRRALNAAQTMNGT
ncbi:MAG: DUF302 domain-containing protein [Vicinamibacterales bacterium]